MANSIDGIRGVNPVSGSASSPFTLARQDAMSVAAGKLGMTLSELRSALSRGSSLEQVAVSKGVTSMDLKNTIEASLKKDLPRASSSQLGELASRMMSAAPGNHGGGHEPESASGSSSSTGPTDSHEASGGVSIVL